MAALVGSMCIVYLLLLLQADRAASSTADSDTTTDSFLVECKTQQEACVCDERQAECHFRLKVEEIQTFVSYKYEDSGDLRVRGFIGINYFFNETGIHPYGSPLPQVVKHLSCWNDQITSVADFISMNCSIPMMVDGRTYHSIIAVNGRIPGPTLVVTEGQKVVIDVHNRLTGQGVTIHWHGLHQRGTPWMDGVAFLSQTPITPGSVFRYSFMASPSGTHWYHSHVATQRADGLFGAFVIREKPDTRKEIKNIIGDFEDSPDLYTITLFDYLRENAHSTYVKTKSVILSFPEKPLVDVPTNTESNDPGERVSDGTSAGPVPFWSGLINGKGRYNSSTYSLLSVFDVDVGRVYRFRVVGAQGVYAYKFEVVGHKLKVISSDGHLFMPVEVDFLIVHTGERYDFILTSDQEPGNYLIRAQILSVVTDDNNVEFVNRTAEAILHYNDVSVPKPNPFTLYDNVIDDIRGCGPIEQCKAINCPFKEFPSELYIDCTPLTNLQSMFPSKESESPDLRALLEDSNSTLFLSFGFDGNALNPSINGRVFQFPPTPYQTYPGQFEDDRRLYPMETCQYCNEESEGTERCDCTHAVQLAKYKKFDDNSESVNNGHVIMVFSAVTLKNTQESHPIHLHGHNFLVVHVGYGEYDNGLLQSSSKHINCTSRCLDPKWNGSVPDFSKYLSSSSGKLRETAIRKDTIIVPAGGYVVVAVPLNNPGYWLLHCHSEPHLFKGMAVILQEYSEDQHPPPPYGINKIGHFFGTEERPQFLSETHGNGWMVGAIVALLLTTLALVVIIGQSVVIVKMKSANNSDMCFRHRHKNGGKYSVFNEQSADGKEMESTSDVHT